MTIYIDEVDELRSSHLIIDAGMDWIHHFYVARNDEKPLRKFVIFYGRLRYFLCMHVIILYFGTVRIFHCLINFYFFG